MAASVGAQLPLLIRGIYYEGWKPSTLPMKWDREEFVEEASKRYQAQLQSSPEEMVRAVWRTLKSTISEGEIEIIASTLPKDIAEFLDGHQGG